MMHGGRRLPPEHHVEFREAEDKRFAPVDKHDVDGLAECIREDGGELEATESRTEDNHACFHRLRAVCTFQRPGCGTMRMYGRGARHPCGYVFFASSSETEPAMMTSSPGFQLTGVATLCVAVSCSESITRSTSSKFRPVVIG